MVGCGAPPHQDISITPRVPTAEAPRASSGPDESAAGSVERAEGAKASHGIKPAAAATASHQAQASEAECVQSAGQAAPAGAGLERGTPPSALGGTTGSATAAPRTRVAAGVRGGNYVVRTTQPAAKVPNNTLFRQHIEPV